MRRELDGVELGQRAADGLLAEHAPDDQLREQHIFAMAELALSLAMARILSDLNTLARQGLHTPRQSGLTTYLAMTASTGGGS
jgi:hypothetical protein